MLRKTTCLLMCLFALGPAHAAISLSSTRVIFDAQYKEATVEVRNQGEGEVLLQSWLDNGNNEDTDNLPFAVSPPLAKAPGKARQQLRVLYQGTGMPTDKESVLWLNVQEIPQNPTGDNVLQLAVRQRIKVFYRPVGLTGEAGEAPAQLQWKVLRDRHNTTSLEVHNPSLFHVSFAQIKLKGKGYDSPMEGTTMLAPGERRTIAMKPLAGAAAPTLYFTSITDFGGLIEYQATMSFTETRQGVPTPRPTESPAT